MLDVEAIRAQFPFFTNNPGYIPFDNATTTQKPGSVIALMNDFYSGVVSPGRGAYDELSTRVTAQFQTARSRVSTFIGADPNDLAFTGGATASLNMIALAWGLKNLRTGDEIMLCLEDHLSTILPWINLRDILRSFGVDIKIVPFKLHPMGNYELEDISAGKTNRTRLIAMSIIHPVTGLYMEVEAVRKRLGDEILISLDATQGIGHRPINVQELPINFLTFSGHKMFAMDGVGALWVSPNLRESLQPIFVGGGMKPEGDLTQLSLPSTTLANIMEAGTPSIAAVLSMVNAIDFIESIGVDAIRSHERSLLKHLYRALQELSGIEFSAGVDHCWHQSHGILTFGSEHVKTSDLAAALGDEKIMVRTGNHCILRKHVGTDRIRVSLHVYNTLEEVDRFVEVLRRVLCSE